MKLILRKIIKIDGERISTIRSADTIDACDGRTDRQTDGIGMASTRNAVAHKNDDDSVR